MNLDRTAHLKGLLRLIHPDEKPRAKRALETVSGRERWLKRLTHQVTMHPDYAAQPPKGQRDKAHLLSSLRKLGAPEHCYIIASDSGADHGFHQLDDRFHSLEYTLDAAYWEFSHGTILSCIPGTLALFRTAFPHKNEIVYRP